MRDAAPVPHSNVCTHHTQRLVERKEKGKAGPKRLRLSAALHFARPPGVSSCKKVNATFPPSLTVQPFSFWLSASFAVRSMCLVRWQLERSEWWRRKGVNGRRRLVRLFTLTKPYQVPFPFFLSSLQKWNLIFKLTIAIVRKEKKVWKEWSTTHLSCDKSTHSILFVPVIHLHNMFWQTSWDWTNHSLWPAGWAGEKEGGFFSFSAHPFHYNSSSSLVFSSPSIHPSSAKKTSPQVSRIQKVQRR